MKPYSLRSILVVFVFASISVALSQVPGSDKITIPLSDPSRPMFLKVGITWGGVSVKGYSGKEVIVETRIRDDSDSDTDNDTDTRSKRAGGLKRILNTSSGLTAEEENNSVSISVGGYGGARNLDVMIQVPIHCSMKLRTVNDGDIVVENVDGDLEINNTNGAIKLKHISGSVVAQTINGEVEVTFSKVNPDKAMSFTSLNGDVDVTFPPTIKATVQMRSEMGEIYSDFDVQMQKSPAKVEQDPKGTKGKYRVTVEKIMRGTINGGGQEIQFKNFNGEIYIRKGS